MKTSQRHNAALRHEIERIAVPDNTKTVPAPQPITTTPGNGGSGRPVIFNLRFQEKTGTKAVDFVKTVIIPTGKLITGTNTAELLFDTLPNGTIHQTLRHTGVGANTWEATSRIETRQSSTLVGLPFDKGCVDVRGYTDTYPLLNIGSNAETSTGWGLRINMPLGQGITSSTLNQNYIETLGDSLPYSLKVANLDTVGSFPLLELRSNHLVNAGTGIDLRHNSRGINVYIPDTTAAGNYVTYGINIDFRPLYTTSMVGGTALNISTIGKYKTGIDVFISDTGVSADNATNKGLRVTVPNKVQAGIFIGTGTRTAQADAVVRIDASATTNYGLDINGMLTASLYAINGAQVVINRQTGWAAPTGTATRTTFNTGTVTLAQLAERVKALIDDLTTHGLIGT